MTNINKKEKVTDSDDSEFLTAKELAHRYRTSDAMIYRWIAQKCFPEDVVLRLGSKILIHREKLEVFESNGGELFK